MTTAPTRPRLGLPLPLIVLLGLLAAPRAVLHDLDVLHEGTGLNALFVFLPLLIWVAVAVFRASNPFLALLAAGGVYGICLVVVHQIFWSPGQTGMPEILLRVAMTMSSLFTGLAVGAVCGGVSWVLARRRTRSGSAVG